MWFKQFVKAVSLLRLFNLTLIFFLPRLSFEESMEKWVSCTSYTFTRSHNAKTVCLESERLQRTLANVVKDRVVLSEYHAFLIYLSFVAFALCSFQGLRCRNFQSWIFVVQLCRILGCVIPVVLHSQHEIGPYFSYLSNNYHGGGMHLVIYTLNKGLVQFPGCKVFEAYGYAFEVLNVD